MSGVAFVCGSLGGAAAVAAVLRGVPAAHPTPIVVVLHRGPFAASTLAATLSAAGRPVEEIFDKMPILPRQCYLAPGGYHLLVEPGWFALSLDPPVRGARPCIDTTLLSAVEVYGSAVTAVILTGASDDGAAGVRAVLSAGGRALVQDPDDAEAAVMPRAALAAGGQKLPLHELGPALAGPT